MGKGITDRKVPEDIDISDVLDEEGWSLLNNLTEEELDLLNADFDPENKLISVGERCSDQTPSKNAAPMFKKEDLVENLERIVADSIPVIKNEKLRHKEELKKQEKEAKLKKQYSRDKPKEKVVLNRQVTLTKDEEDLLDGASEEELIEAAAKSESGDCHITTTNKTQYSFHKENYCDSDGTLLDSSEKSDDEEIENNNMTDKVTQLKNEIISEKQKYQRLIETSRMENMSDNDNTNISYTESCDFNNNCLSFETTQSCDNTIKNESVKNTKSKNPVEMDLNILLSNGKQKHSLNSKYYEDDIEEIVICLDINIDINERGVPSASAFCKMPLLIENVVNMNEDDYIENMESDIAELQLKQKPSSKKTKTSMNSRSRHRSGSFSKRKTKLKSSEAMEEISAQKKTCVTRNDESKRHLESFQTFSRSCDSGLGPTPTNLEPEKFSESDLSNVQDVSDRTNIKPKYFSRTRTKSFQKPSTVENCYCSIELNARNKNRKLKTTQQYSSTSTDDEDLADGKSNTVSKRDKTNGVKKYRKRNSMDKNMVKRQSFDELSRLKKNVNNPKEILSIGNKNEHEKDRRKNGYKNVLDEKQIKGDEFRGNKLDTVQSQIPVVSRTKDLFSKKAFQKPCRELAQKRTDDKNEEILKIQTQKTDKTKFSNFANKKPQSRTNDKTVKLDTTSESPFKNMLRKPNLNKVELKKDSHWKKLQPKSNYQSKEDGLNALEAVRGKLRKVPKPEEVEKESFDIIPLEERLAKRDTNNGDIVVKKEEKTEKPPSRLMELLQQDQGKKDCSRPKPHQTENVDHRGVTAAALQQALLKMNGMLTSDQINAVWSGDKPQGASIKNKTSVKGTNVAQNRITKKDVETELDIVELMRCCRNDTDDLFYICINNQPKLEKNIKLEVIKAVERSTKVKHLSMAMTGLIDSEVKELAKAIRYNRQIETLNLESNIITMHGIKVLMKEVSKHPTLREVKVSNQKQPFGLQGEECMAEAINQNENILKFGYSFMQAGPRNKADRAIIRHNENMRQRRKKGEDVYDLKAACKIRDPFPQPWIKEKGMRGLAALIENKVTEMGHMVGAESKTSSQPKVQREAKPFNINDLLAERKTKLQGPKVADLEAEQEKKRKKQLEEMDEYQKKGNAAVVGKSEPLEDTTKKSAGGKKIANLDDNEPIRRKKKDESVEGDVNNNVNDVKGDKGKKKPKEEDGKKNDISRVGGTKIEENKIARKGKQMFEDESKKKDEIASSKLARGVGKNVPTLSPADSAVDRQKKKVEQQDLQGSGKKVAALEPASNTPICRGKKGVAEKDDAPIEKKVEAGKQAKKVEEDKTSLTGKGEKVASLPTPDVGVTPTRRRRNRDTEEETSTDDVKSSQDESTYSSSCDTEGGEGRRSRRSRPSEDTSDETPTRRSRASRRQEENDDDVAPVRTRRSRRGATEEENEKAEEPKSKEPTSDERKPAVDLFASHTVDDQPKKMSLKERLAQRGR